jgi:hypothetical protein
VGFENTCRSGMVSLHFTVCVDNTTHHVCRLA